jgi:hypothetical protein
VEAERRRKFFEDNLYRHGEVARFFVSVLSSINNDIPVLRPKREDPGVEPSTQEIFMGRPR